VGTACGACAEEKINHAQMLKKENKKAFTILPNLVRKLKAFECSEGPF
jgi:hypothetical protein